MNALITLKPAEGRRVRHPDGRLLEEAGEPVAPSEYWTRRLTDQDAETVPAKPAKKDA